MDWPLVGTFAAALLAILNPIAGTPIYLAATAEDAAGLRTRVAFLIGVFIFGLLVACFFFGGPLLAALGITMAAFRIAGGVLLLLIGLDMARQPLVRSREQRATHERVAKGFEAARARFRDLITPIVVPLIVGPGSISTVVLYGDQAPNLTTRGAMIVVIGAAAVAVFVCLSLASVLKAAIGETGMSISSRLLGILLTAIAVQLMIAGLTEAFPGLTAS